MRTRTPMDTNSTLLLSYFEITETPSDLIADAFGIDVALSALLPEMQGEPSDDVIARLFEKIKHGNKKD
jgi:hypothetical protein